LKPFVSVIIPCRNEIRFLGRCLDSILANDYPADRMEVLVADGMSSDGTRELIDSCSARDARVRRVDNPRRITAVALNRAIEAASGDVIVRVDAHSAISSDYISKAVGYLETTGAWNVGGTMHTIAEGEGPFAEPIRLVLTHRFGVGNSHFRTGSSAPRWVDTVFGGCWPRWVFERIGGFNEQLVRSQDMEFNTRLCRVGGKILLAPDLESKYWARADLAYFVRHNWANGVWAVLPFAFSEGAAVRLRHLVPLGFVGALLATLVGALFDARFGWVALGLAALYLAVSLGVSMSLGWRARSSRASSLRTALLLPIAFASLHWVYGAGSLWGLVRLAKEVISKRMRTQELALEQKETL
jgi:glycosyltransferase involved in cell wall biosynthesis